MKVTDTYSQKHRMTESKLFQHQKYNLRKLMKMILNKYVLYADFRSHIEKMNSRRLGTLGTWKTSGKGYCSYRKTLVSPEGLEENIITLTCIVHKLLKYDSSGT